jgi:hypothetical protein
MMRLLFRIAAAATAGVVALAIPLAASAHEHRHVGKYTFTVGWGEEPAYAGFKNSVELILADAADKPITDLGDTLKVTVETAGKSQEYSLEPGFDIEEHFGTPGDYRAWLVPTLPGNYTFHFTGTIHGDKIDQKFTSSDTTFDAVKDQSEVQFPVKAPSAKALADRLARDEARNDKDVKSARTLAIVGIAVGIVALIAGAGLGLSRRGR